MKKYVSCMIAFFMMFFLVSCGSKNLENVREKDSFDIKQAEATVENYLKLIKSEQYDEANKLVIDDVKVNKEELGNNNLKISQYTILEMNETNDEAKITVGVIKSNAQKPETLTLEEEIVVKRQGTNYKIYEVNILPKREAFVEGRMIRMKNEDSADTNLLVSMVALPKYAYSKDDKAKMNILEVPRKEFGVMQFDFEGNNIAISSFDVDAFVGVLTIDDTMLTQAQAQTNSGGTEKSGQSDVGGKVIEEIPVGKKIIVCDILRNAEVSLMNFSLDQRYLAVQYSTRDNSKKSIRLYDISNGNMVGSSFEDEFPLNKVQVVFESFEEESMIFNVVPKTESDKNNEYVGKWQLDLKELNFKKDK